MNKITVKASKLRVKDRIKVAGITYKITSLQQNFGRKKTKSNFRFVDRVHVSACSTGDDTHDYQRFSFPGDTKLTVRRK